MFKRFAAWWNRQPYMKRRRIVAGSVAGNALAVLALVVAFGLGSSPLNIRSCGPGGIDWEIKPKDGGGWVLNKPSPAAWASQQQIDYMGGLSNNCELPSGPCSASNFSGQNLRVLDGGSFGSVAFTNAAVTTGVRRAVLRFDTDHTLGFYPDSATGSPSMTFNPSGTGFLITGGIAATSILVANGGLFNNQQLAQVLAGTNPTDATNLAQVQALIAGGGAVPAVCPFSVKGSDGGILYTVDCAGGFSYSDAAGEETFNLVAGDATFSGAVQAVGFNAAGGKLSGLQAGDQPTDAVNLTQATALAASPTCPVTFRGADGGPLGTLACDGTFALNNTNPSVLFQVNPSGSATLLGKLTAAGLSADTNKITDGVAATAATDFPILSQTQSIAAAAARIPTCPFVVQDLDGGTRANIGCNGEFSILNNNPSVSLNLAGNDLTILGNFSAAGGDFNGGQIHNVTAASSANDVVTLSQLQTHAFYYLSGYDPELTTAQAFAAQLAPANGALISLQVIVAKAATVAGGSGYYDADVDVYDNNTSTSLCTATVHACCGSVSCPAPGGNTQGQTGLALCVTDGGANLVGGHQLTLRVKSNACTGTAAGLSVNAIGRLY